MKLEKACRICEGKQKTPCMICGWKADKKTKKEMEREKDAARHRKERQDFLGRIYNGMRRFKMHTTGLLATRFGEYCNEIVLICANNSLETGEENVTVMHADGKKETVPWKSVSIRGSQIDDAVIREIGDPLEDGAPEYIPNFKLKKNEV